MLYSIVIPCYNEADNIAQLVNKFYEIYKNNSYIELILVDNGSTDNTNQLIKENMEKYDFIKLVEVMPNIGYGNGIKQGLLSAHGDYMCIMHADMQSNPDEIIKGINYLQSHNYPEKIFIKSLRKNRPILDRFFTFGMSIFETIYLKTFLHDITAQPTIFHRSFFYSLENIPDDFLFDLYLYYNAKKMHYTIYRFPIIQNDRMAGTSSWNTGLSARIKLIKRVLEYSRRLK